MRAGGSGASKKGVRVAATVGQDTRHEPVAAEHDGPPGYGPALGRGEPFEAPELTPQELRLRRMLRGFVGLSALFMVAYIAGGISGHSEFPFVANSCAKDGLFLLMGVIAAADVRRFSFAVLCVIIGHALLVIALATMAIAGQTSSVAHTFGLTSGLFGLSQTDTAQLIALAWLALALSVVLQFTWLYESAQRARFGLRYLSNAEFRTLTALAEVLVDTNRPDRPSAGEVAKRVDEYLYSFEASGKKNIRLALLGLAFYPLALLHAPFSMMAPADRLAFVRKHFVTDVSGRHLLGPLRTVVQAMIRAAQQMTFMGYYGDSRVGAAVGYLPFSERPGALAKIAAAKRSPSVASLGPRDVAGELVHADVVIIGSGAAGATLAYELAARGREVLVLERGHHVDPSQFTENEAEQFSRLYADGALQLSTDFRFQVAQGMCVGGSTVVNNAVCFDLPAPVLTRWNDPDGADARLDTARLRASFAHMRDWLPVHTQDRDPGTLNPGGRMFLAGLRALGFDRPPYSHGIVDCNIEGCLGCGYCNIGCAYGRKLSMLDNTLPRAQRDHGPDAVRVLAECRAERIEAEGRRATGVRCRLSDGRRVTVRARTIVISAGALASSMLLLGSRLGGPLVGQRLSFNLATPLTADFAQVLNSERGLQISHYLEPPGSEAFALETWFNPVMFQSLVMPGWFDEHAANMRRYRHLTCVGAVVGSRADGTVSRSLLGAMKLSYRPHADDLAALVAGLRAAGRVMLAAGAERVMPLTFGYHEYRSEDELARLGEAIRDDSDLSVNTAHPQGGNALSANRDRGVVDPSFRVHGFDNLHVCDASVFPSSITVNPQLTVMALAHYAAQPIAQGA